MSVYTWLDYRVQLRNDLTNKICECKNKHIERAVNNMQSLILAIEQEENYLWYKGNPDYLMWFYTRGIVENGFQNIFNQYIARNWVNYYWTKSALEDGIKRTHSGLPRQAIVFLDRALGDPIIKCKDIDKNKAADGMLIVYRTFLNLLDMSDAQREAINKVCLESIKRCKEEF